MPRLNPLTAAKWVLRQDQISIPCPGCRKQYHYVTFDVAIALEAHYEPASDKTHIVYRPFARFQQFHCRLVEEEEIGTLREATNIVKASFQRYFPDALDKVI